MTYKICALFYNFSTIYQFVHNKVTFFTISTRHMLVKTRMPRQEQSQNMANISNFYILAPPMGGGAWDVSEVRRSNRLAYSPSLLTVSSPKLSLLHVVGGTELRTDRQTDVWTNRRTEDPITTCRCPRRTFHYFGVPNTATATIHNLSTYKSNTPCV